MRGLVAAAALLLARTAAAAEPRMIVSTAGFRGESCQVCHETIRDRAPGPSGADGVLIPVGFYDAVVVGGGLSGLVAAHYLKDFRILVLDKESKVGGKFRRESFDNRPYPVAGVYMGEPTGKVQDLFKSLGLKIEPVTLLAHSINIGGTVVPNWLSDDPSGLPYPTPVQERLRKMQAFLRDFIEHGGIELPIESSQAGAIDKLERFSLRQYIENGYGREAGDLADLFSRDVFGVSGDHISAAAGLYFFSSELAPAFTWAGGLGKASEVLGEELGPRISTGSFVWKVLQDPGGASVRYSQGGRDFEARARAVIFATPSMVTRRIASDLGEEKRAAMAKVRYSSYALVPLKLKAVRSKDAFIHWTPGRVFTDLTSPVPNAEPLRGTTTQVLVAYVPMGESEGRRKLLAAPDSELTAKVLADLDTVFPGGSSDVVEARVVRWGHAMPVPYPGFLSKVRPALAAPEGRYFFAGVDTQLPCFEGAVYSGLRAADAARKFLQTPDSAKPSAPR
ncbi:MAG: FAD-dependent oxidoreductase [Elusimicrobia bacterium]|nr:FAD-dependent oxidoreductase [Elusimicrobiota bacterium]